MKKFICHQCNKTFLTFPSLRRSRFKFCSHSCRSKWSKTLPVKSPPPMRISNGSTTCKQCGKDKKIGFRQRAFLCNACYLKKNHLVIRKKVLEHYGGKCVCCGEFRYEFLAFDHIDGGGLQHRKREKISNLDMWIHSRDYPDGFQILCHNCNAAKGFYGKCPHQEEK